MSNLALYGIIVVLIAALVVAVFAWRVAIHDADNSDDFVLYLIDELIPGTHTLTDDGVHALQDEAWAVRAWRGEVRGDE